MEKVALGLPFSVLNLNVRLNAAVKRPFVTVMFQSVAIIDLSRGNPSRYVGVNQMEF